MQNYTDRWQAGDILAKHLKKYAQDTNALVLALPRGGVPVAYQVAKTLQLPLDVYIVRKLGYPGHEEYAMGALASGDTLFFNENIKALAVSKETIERVIDAEKLELQRRETLYRGKRSFPNLKDKTVILVDDGIATGATIHAAIKGLRKLKPAHMIVAIPVAAQSSFKEIAALVDEVVCPLTPNDLSAVGLWYDDFSQTSDAEVIELLANANDWTLKQ